VGFIEKQRGRVINELRVAGGEWQMTIDELTGHFIALQWSGQEN